MVFPVKYVLVVLIAIASSGFLLADDRLRVLALNSALLGGSVAVLSLLVGTPLALAIARCDVSGRRLATLVLASLLFIPLYVKAAAWQAVWGVQGWLTTALGMQPLTGWPAVIWIHAAASIPWVVLIAAIGFRHVEPELEEDALLDATPSAVLLRVTLRRSWPALAAAACWVIRDDDERNDGHESVPDSNTHGRSLHAVRAR